MKEWECRKCGVRHEPENEGFSIWRCKNCQAVRWSWIPWVFGIAVTVALVIGVWILLPVENPEERFISQVKHYLTGKTGKEGEISQDEMKQLSELANRLKLTKKMDRLIRQGKETYLSEMRERFLNNPPKGKITQEELETLCQVANTMGIEAQECVVSMDEVKALLRKGAFTEAKRLLQDMPASPEKEKLVTELNTDLGLDVKFQYKMDTKEPSPQYPVDASDLNDLKLSHRDNYRLFISVSHNNAFLYVYQKDHYGQIERLFPDPVWSKADNPIQAGTVYQIPPEQKTWLYLDELPSENPVEETLYLIVSPYEAEDLVNLHGEIYKATSKQTREELIRSFQERLELRKDTPFKAVQYKTLSFQHGR